MLTVQPEPAAEDPLRHRRRLRAIAAAALPTARVAHLGSAAATVALGAIPAAVTIPRGDDAVSAPTVVATIVCAAALGWAADDPPAGLLGSMPVSSPQRAALRTLAVALVAGAGWALIGILLRIGPGLPAGVSDRVPEAAAAAAVALGVGAIAVRRGERAVGPIGVAAGIIGVSVVAGLAVRWPAQLPTFMPSSAHHRWWMLAVAGALVVCRWGRDPAAP